MSIISFNYAEPVLYYILPSLLFVLNTNIPYIVYSIISVDVCLVGTPVWSRVGESCAGCGSHGRVGSEESLSHHHFISPLSS